MELALFVVFIIFSALFSGFEMAYVSQSRLLHAANLSGRLSEFFGASPRKVLITILIGNNITITGATITLTHIFMGVMGKAASAASAALVAGAFLLIFGETLPKAIGRARSQWVVRTFAPAIYGFWLLFRPLVNLLDKVVPGREGNAELEEALFHAGFEPQAVQLITLMSELRETRLGDLARWDGEVKLKNGVALYTPPERALAGADPVEIPVYPEGATVGEAAEALAKGPVAVVGAGKVGLVDAREILRYFKKNGARKKS